MESFNKLRMARVSKGLTQIEFSEQVGISVSSYRLKEQGKVSFTLEEAKRIADFLCMSIEEIFY